MNCTIKSWREDDAEDLAYALSNKKVLKNLRDGLPYPYTKADALSYIHAMQQADPNATFAYAIVAEDKVIGSIGAFRQDNIHFQTAEMGYYIGEDYWGQGLMTEAVALLCDYIFTNTDIVRIYAEPFHYNVASCRVLEKNGFQLEGVLHKNALKDGTYLDMNLYAKIKPE